MRKCTHRGIWFQLTSKQVVRKQLSTLQLLGLKDHDPLKSHLFSGDWRTRPGLGTASLLG
jgi:hypothetical protein